MIKVSMWASLARLLQNTAGNILPITAVAMFVLAGLVGSGVDVSRSYMIKNRLQSACDAGVLAGRRGVATDGYDTAANDQAERFFAINFSESNLGATNTEFAATSPDGGNTIEATASTRVPMTIMKVFAVDSIPLDVSCTSSMSVGNSDVMFVLDVTGSMACSMAMDANRCTDYVNFTAGNATCGGANVPTYSEAHINCYLTSKGLPTPAQATPSRMAELRNAMTEFYSTVDAALAGSNARVRYGIVPYAATVNAGGLIMATNSSYIADTVTLPSRQADEFDRWSDPVTRTGTSYNNEVTRNPVYHDYVKYNNNASCLNNKPANILWQNDGAATTSTSTTINSEGQQVETTSNNQPQKQIIYECYYAQPGNNSTKGYYIGRTEATRTFSSFTTNTRDPIYKVATSPSDVDRFRFRDVTYNVSGLKTASTIQTLTGRNYSSGRWNYFNETQNWDQKCIVERATSAVASVTYTQATGLSPASAFDVDIDTIPSSDATRWKMFIPSLSNLRFTDNNYNILSDASESAFGSSYGGLCPVNIVRALQTMNSTFFAERVAELLPAGGTYHDIGMIWGARLMSQNGPFASTVNLAAPNGQASSRHIIFMTDGQMSTSSTAYGAWGLEWHERRITADGQSDNDARHTSRFLAACAAAKAKGLRLWVIALSTELTNELTTCASADSAFLVVNRQQLTQRFQEIAQIVGELRITQ